MIYHQRKETMDKLTKVFAQNLRFLTETAESVSALCVELNMNRQQYNKYLSGKHLPSRRNIALIARFFSVSEKDFFIDSERFRRVYENANRRISHAIQGSFLLKEYAVRLQQNSDEFRGFLGIYARYQVSSIYKNTVLRSIMRIYEKDGFLYYYYIERFKSLDNPKSVAFEFKYHGVCNVLEGKVFLIDAETQQHNELTFAVLTPIARLPQRLLFGLATGVAADVFREPFSTRVALTMLSGGALRPSHLRLASSLSPDDPSIPEEVRLYLGLTRSECGKMLRGGG